MLSHYYNHECQLAMSSKQMALKRGLLSMIHSQDPLTRFKGVTSSLRGKESEGMEISPACEGVDLWADVDRRCASRGWICPSDISSFYACAHQPEIVWCASCEPVCDSSNRRTLFAEELQATVAVYAFRFYARQHSSRYALRVCTAGAVRLSMIRTFPPGHISRTCSPGHFPRPDNSPSFFTWCRTFPPYHHHHAPKRSIVNVYKIDSGYGQECGLVPVFSRVHCRSLDTDWRVVVVVGRNVLYMM